MRGAGVGALALLGFPLWSCTGGAEAPGSSDPVTAFEEAVAVRPFRPRLALDLEYRGCGPLETGGGECLGGPGPGSDRFLPAANTSAEARTALLSSSDAEDLRARGLWELVWHTWNPRAIDRAVVDLERAAESGSADALNDLAVAYLERSRVEGRALDLVRALGALERARAVSPHHRAASFNRALVLEAFSLSRESRMAWEAYLELDPDSPWSEEARDALAAAEQRIAVSQSRGRRALATPLLEGDSSTVAEAARTSPQVARELAYGPVLSSWVGSETRVGAEAAVARLRWIGSGLVDGSVRGLAQLLQSAEGDRRSAVRSAAERFLEGAALAGEGRSLEAALAYREVAATPAVGVLGEWARLNAGTAYFNMSRYAEAVPLFESARDQTDEAFTPLVVGRSDWISGLIAMRRGLYGEAVGRLDPGVRRYGEAGEVENGAWVRVLKAEALSWMGRHEEAWRERIAALAALHRVPPGPRLQGALMEMGDAAARQDMVEAGLVLLDAAVRVADGLEYTPFLGDALVRRAMLLRRAGLHSRARSDLARAKAIRPTFPDPESRAIMAARIWAAEAEALRDEQPRVAVELYDSLIAHHESRENGIGLAQDYLGRGIAHRRAGALDDYTKDLGRAIDLIERQALSLRDPVRTVAFATAADEVFDEAVRHWALGLDDPHGALEFEERRRRLVLGPPGGELPARPWSQLPEGTVALEYAVLDDRVLRWEIRSDGVAFHESPATPEELSRAAGDFARALKERSPAVDSLGRQLHRLLGLSALDLAVDGSRLVVIPDGFLNQFPFAALVDPGSGEFLVERTAVAVAPHLGFLAAAVEEPSTRPGSDGWSALLVGAASVDPTVLPSLAATPWSATELEDLAELYPEETVLVGEAANRATFMRELGEASVLHYAGHAVHDPVEPEASHLVLSASEAEQPADLVLARELDPLAMPLLRLVILSACNSATPTPDAAGGFWGLAHPFLRAGADAVVGTLWAADDEAARELQLRFHEAWLRGQDSAEALRAAQIELIRDPDPRRSAPRAWAAFQSIGIAW